MQDLGGRPLTAREVEERAPDLVEIVRRVHEDEAFQDAVAAVGLQDVAKDQPPDWFVASLDRVREIAPSDQRLAMAERWLERERRLRNATDLINSVMVHGHGDLHREKLAPHPGRPRLDRLGGCWIGAVGPGACEPDRLRPSCPTYRRPTIWFDARVRRGCRALERSTAQHALYLYVYWLRRLLEAESVDPGDVAYAEDMCEIVFG